MLNYIQGVREKVPLKEYYEEYKVNRDTLYNHLQGTR